MKKIFFLVCLMLSAMMVSSETMRVAILEPVDRENKVSYGTKLILRSNLSKAVTNTAGYEAYDRTDMDAIMGEQNFQRTGMVSEEQIKRLGEMTGAKYILVAEAAVIDANNMFITAKVLDVESARTIMTDNLMMGMDAAKIQEGCIKLAMNLFHSYTERDNSLENTTTTSRHTTSQTVPQKKKLIRYSSMAKRKAYNHGKEFAYGNLEMDEKEMLIFLADRCPEAFKKIVDAKQVQTGGWSILGMTCFGAVPIYIPLLAAGYVKYDKAIEYFNNNCDDEE